MQRNRLEYIIPLNQFYLCFLFRLTSGVMAVAVAIVVVVDVMVIGDSDARCSDSVKLGVRLTRMSA